MSDRPSDVPSPPSYIRFDKKQREEFLSQYGVTSPAQRELFHELCDAWRPLIDFEAFATARTGLVTHPANETENLVNRLRAAKMAQFTYRKNEKGERLPKDIILCEENSPRFWFHYVQDLIQQACDNPRNPFLTPGLLRSREIALPMDLVGELPMPQVSKAGLEALSRSEALVYLQLVGERILATSQTVTLLLSFSSAKLRFTLKNTEVTAAVSRILNLSLTEVTKRLEDKESGFWRGLTETLLARREDLLADRRLHLDASFFQAAELFNRYLTNQVEEIQKQKAAAQERETDLKQIEQLVLLEKDGIMPPGDLDGHIKLLFHDKYGQVFEGFRDEFYLNFTQSSQKTSLPIVVTLVAGLVHRNNLYKVFLRRFEALTPALIHEYRVKMGRRLRGHGRDDLDFLNRENLERSLVEWTAKADPFLGEVLGRPKLLGEAIIHHGRTALGMAGVDDMKPLLERFFRPGVMTLKPYAEIYSLDVPQLYEEAFKGLSVVAQFWRRLNGTYRIQAEELRGLALPKEKREPKPSARAEEVPLEALSPEELKARREEWKRRKQAAAVTKKGESAPAAAPVEKVYSQGEREKAWKGFQETIKKD